MFIKSINFLVFCLATYLLRTQAIPLTKSTRSLSRRCSPRGRTTANTNSNSLSTSNGNGSNAKTATGKAQGAQSFQALFPLGRGSTSWTTSDRVGGALPLSDSTLQPTNDMKELSHDVTKAPDGAKAMEALYPKGSMNPGQDPAGGISFYALGPKNVDLTKAKEITLGYSVYFEKGFKWVQGGKLPGVYGGNNAEVAVSCSGGRRDDACFSARLMWRDDGKGEFYTYFPPSAKANKKQCNVKPESDCNDTYGTSVGRGAFHFKDGAWTTVTERVRLNDVGKENGEIELFANGKSVINVKGLTFFGGSHHGFEAAKDSKAWFKDFSMAITKEL
ncbi:hypothetical protein DL96DRAFT_1600096 [Flagelloscypha sp. PMI_526]|nr:hypothetical protein DL96DRAFT_1600096 [Flagelloscypha sp. PMI_526]